jgi:hypothetical protein
MAHHIPASICAVLESMKAQHRLRVFIPRIAQKVRVRPAITQLFNEISEEWKQQRLLKSNRDCEAPSVTSARSVCADCKCVFNVTSSNVK